MGFGDEYTDTYYRCAACGMYTMASFRDRFAGEDTWRTSNPIEEKNAARLLAIIARCPTPNDKRCACPAHLEYFE